MVDAHREQNASIFQAATSANAWLGTRAMANSVLVCIVLCILAIINHCAQDRGCKEKLNCSLSKCYIYEAQVVDDCAVLLKNVDRQLLIGRYSANGMASNFVLRNLILLLLLLLLTSAAFTTTTTTTTYIHTQSVLCMKM